MKLTIEAVDVNLHTIDEEKILRSLQRLERRQLWIVEALHVLVKKQLDEATIAELTAKLNAEAETLNASIEASK